MHNSFCHTSLMRVGKESYVVYISAAIEFKEEARTWVQEAHEHQERPQGFGAPTSQRTSSVDGLNTV